MAITNKVIADASGVWRSLCKLACASFLCFDHTFADFGECFGLFCDLFCDLSCDFACAFMPAQALPDHSPGALTPASEHGIGDAR